jgi:transcription antitermination protein NusB
VRRRIIREKVVQALYAHEISGDPLDHVIACVLVGLEDNKAAHEFAKNLVAETVKHSEDIDKIIRARVANWDFKRIAILDRLILRMGICELLYFREIPPKVTMNEAIELAKLFSTERSGQFVNGVLDAVLNDIKNVGPEQLGDGAVVKAGRGLYEGETAERPAKPRKPAP